MMNNLKADKKMDRKRTQFITKTMMITTIKLIQVNLRIHILLKQILKCLS